jgi:hypothetical protein
MSDTPRTDEAYAASTGSGIYEMFKESQDIERELNAAQQRIKRLEEAGDELAGKHLFAVHTYDNAKKHVAEWYKSKEGKP